MKKTKILKLAAVALISSGLVVGCASTEQPAAPTPEVKQECPTAAAKNAIYSAKIKLARAEKLGYAWRDTGKMIADAEKAAAECDSEKAIALANKAAEQAEDAIAQAKAEADRYAQQQAEMDSSAMTDAGSYTVVSGDNLWNISGQSAVYGNPYQWPLIYKANSDKIKDADLIFPGQEFSIPSATASEIDAAVEHAKTRGAWSIGAVEESDQNYLAQ
jgi:Sec-independent protein translocase protein TatA